MSQKEKFIVYMIRCLVSETKGERCTCQYLRGIWIWLNKPQCVGRYCFINHTCYGNTPLYFVVIFFVVGQESWLTIDWFMWWPVTFDLQLKGPKSQTSTQTLTLPKIIFCTQFSTVLRSFWYCISHWHKRSSNQPGDGWTIAAFGYGLMFCTASNQSIIRRYSRAIVFDSTQTAGAWTSGSRDLKNLKSCSVGKKLSGRRRAQSTRARTCAGRLRPMSALGSFIHVEVFYYHMHCSPIIVWVVLSCQNLIAVL